MNTRFLLRFLASFLVLGFLIGSYPAPLTTRAGGRWVPFDGTTIYVDDSNVSGIEDADAGAFL